MMMSLSAVVWQWGQVMLLGWVVQIRCFRDKSPKRLVKEMWIFMAMDLGIQRNWSPKSP